MCNRSTLPSLNQSSFIVLLVRFFSSFRYFLFSSKPTLDIENVSQYFPKKIDRFHILNPSQLSTNKTFSAGFQKRNSSISRWQFNQSWNRSKREKVDSIPFWTISECNCRKPLKRAMLAQSAFLNDSHLFLSSLIFCLNGCNAHNFKFSTKWHTCLLMVDQSEQP